MHGLTFSVKRAHWATTWFAIREFRRKASSEKREELRRMTPARFDILFLMHEQRRLLPYLGYGIAQYDIRKRLGLHRTTISKMITAMVHVGFVTRTPHPFRRGAQMIDLTALGVRAIRSALHSVFTDHRLRTRIEAYAARFVPRGRKRRFTRHPIMLWLVRVVDAARGFFEHFGTQADTVFWIDEELES